MWVELIATAIGLVVLPLFCIAIEHYWPSISRPAVTGQQSAQAELISDIVWYFTQSLIARLVAPWLVFFVVLPILLILGQPMANYWDSFGPISHLPLILQLVIVFAASDFLAYWAHRAFHLPALWPIHAIHHSSERLTWLSATRFHPFNEILNQLIFVTPLLAIGFSPKAFVWLAPFTAFYSVVLHANVKWDFGPLRYIIASPLYHRWHHTTEAAGLDKNFAGFLPLWDWLFGTLYFPRHRHPDQFGVHDHVPAGVWPQLVYPFKSTKPAVQNQANQSSNATTNTITNIDTPIE